jgi:succinate-semialdehyde dehydrogenase / glutarate-semialdehyde dehydrogenase
VIDDPRIKGIALTGSSALGRHWPQELAKISKKSTMEFGGSDPFIVLDDADLDHTVAAILGRFSNNGQTG